MKATDFLRKGADLLEERGRQYDQPDGERSMGKAVSAFNTVTGRDLRESEGWLLLQILKDVRQWQNPDKYHADSAEDCVSYAALKAEALASESAAGYVDRHDTFGKPLPLEPAATTVEISHPSFGAMTYVDGQQVHCEPAADIDDESDRASAIGQNGNDGLHYDADKPSWDDAPAHAVVYIDWTGSITRLSPGFYADGGDRFLRIVDGFITEQYVMKDGIESLGYPVYYRPSKDA